LSGTRAGADPGAAAGTGAGELSLDTPNPEAMAEGLRLHRGRALVNSLSGESKRIQALLPLIREYRPRVIALCLDDDGLPKTSDKEVEIAERLADLLSKQGLAQEDIFIDPLVRPIGVDENAANLFLESLEKIKRRMPTVKTIAGISNVSYGMPGRRALNRAFLILALERGLDAAILDPLDKELLAGLHSAGTLLGRDSLKSYLSFMRRTRDRGASQAS
jgi:5-methyltetrahydrofolate--homocysteine methyltransferase